MLYQYFICIAFLICSTNSIAQVADTSNNTIVFISDTQEPLWVEKLAHKNTKQNALATQILFNHINTLKPKNVFLLGDIVALGYKTKFWKNIDQYLDTLHKNNINTYAVLGNHDVMFNKSKGIKKFTKRFPNQSTAGYYIIVDSVAMVMLNSNFKKLSKQEYTTQQDWYRSCLKLF